MFCSHALVGESSASQHQSYATTVDKSTLCNALTHHAAAHTPLPSLSLPTHLDKKKTKRKKEKQKKSVTIQTPGILFLRGEGICKFGCIFGICVLLFINVYNNKIYNTKYQNYVCFIVFILCIIHILIIFVFKSLTFISLSFILLVGFHVMFRYYFIYLDLC